MENTNNTPNGGAQGTESPQGRTFTQDDVNRIVQERLAKEKGRNSEELDKRAAELDMRERRLNAAEELRKNGIPDYMVDALNMNTEEDFQKSLEAIKKMKGEAAESQQFQPGEFVGSGNPIGTVHKGPGNIDLRQAFGL